MKVNFKSLVQITLVAGAVLSLNACGNAQAPGQLNSVYRQMQSQAQNKSQIQQQIVVRFRPEATRTQMQEFNGRYQLQTENFIPGINAYVMSFRNEIQNKAAMQALIAQISRDAAIAYVEANQNIQVAPVPYDLHTQPVFK